MPVFANVTGAGESDPEKLKKLLVRQMTSSVRWIDTMASLYEAGARTFVELGPKGVLTKMVKPNLEGRDGVNAMGVATAQAAQEFVLP